jgi:hypothetical protein
VKKLNLHWKKTEAALREHRPTSADTVRGDGGLVRDFRFRISNPKETNALTAARDLNPDITITNLRIGRA